MQNNGIPGDIPTPYFMARKILVSAKIRIPNEFITWAKLILVRSHQTYNFLVAIRGVLVLVWVGIGR